MRVAYAALLRLYPAPFRDVFASEMAEVFDSVQADRRARGFFEFVSFILAEMAGVIGGAFWMWSAGMIGRSRRRFVRSYWTSIAAGAAITAFFHWFFYSAMTTPRFATVVDHPLPSVMSVNVVALLIAGGILIFLAVFSIAFVWNMRIIGNRAGRLKPIWMPAGDARSRKKAARPKLAPIYNLDRPK